MPRNSAASLDPKQAETAKVSVGQDLTPLVKSLGIKHLRTVDNLRKGGRESRRSECCRGHGDCTKCGDFGSEMKSEPGGHSQARRGRLTAGQDPASRGTNLSLGQVRTSFPTPTKRTSSNQDAKPAFNGKASTPRADETWWDP